MKSAAELEKNLMSINRRSYPAYKDLRGSYQFQGYQLNIDHVQGDPFASPSKLSIQVKKIQARFPEEYYKKLLEVYTEKRNHFLSGLDCIGLKHNIPQGTYFVLIDITEFLELPQFHGFTDLEFCEWMIRNIGVAAVPGSSFFKEDVNNLIRLHFAREKETLDEALRRLAKLKEI